MEIKIENTKFITKWLESKVRQARQDVEVELERIPTLAQNNYNKFEIEVPADDPRVDVVSTFRKSKDVSTLNVECIGNQVLFIEFGAGKTFYTDNEVKLYKRDMPIVERPSTIYDIGGYGSGRGKDDVWFYKSYSGRESKNAHRVKFNASGSPIMITHGNRPSRSLYRAVGIAMRRIRLKLGGGRTRRIAPPPMN